MAIEKKWSDVAPAQFTQDGTANGIIKLGRTTGFKVKQDVVLQSATQPQITLQVKRVSKTQIIVGPKQAPQSQNNMTARADITAYTVADGAFVFAAEQDKTTLKPDDIRQAVYEQEPTVAIRTVFVDPEGDFYDEGNPLPIAFDGTISVGNVTIQDDDGDELAINSDGSLNVVIANSVDSPGLDYQYSEALAVPAGVETTVMTITSPIGEKRLQKVEVSGDNVAFFTLKYNGDVVAKKRIWHGDFNAEFEFEIYVNGFKMLPGDVVTVTVIHNRPFIGDFNATAWFL